MELGFFLSYGIEWESVEWNGDMQSVDAISGMGIWNQWNGMEIWNQWNGMEIWNGMETHQSPPHRFVIGLPGGSGVSAVLLNLTTHHPQLDKEQPHFTSSLKPTCSSCLLFGTYNMMRKGIII